MGLGTWGSEIMIMVCSFVFFFLWTLFGGWVLAKLSEWARKVVRFILG